MHNVLIVGLERKARQRLAELIEQFGLDARTAGTLDQARQVMRKYTADAIMIDSGVDGTMGLQAIATLPLKPHQRVVLLTDDTDSAMADAVNASDTDMFEFMPHEPSREDLDELLKSIKRLRAERERRAHDQAELFESMLGNCPEMLEVYSMIAKVAPTNASVLICGESGTGKELVARAIHGRSDRSERPFIAVNCGAIAENLIESELFGHEKGAFTGADKARSGFFEQADGGTLFLDEITEMPLEVQVRFLRVLENGVLRRLGSEKETRVDVRVVAATNQEPQQAVKQGRFREDLMYRLAVFPVTLPPLRERGDDIGLLAGHFLSLHNKANKTRKQLTDLAHQRLARYDWPGNVRQLRNIVQRAYILEGTDVNLDCLEDLLDEQNAGTCGEAVNSPDSVDDQQDDAPRSARQQPTGEPTTNGNSVVQVEVGTSIDDAEKQLILKTLHNLDGNKTEAAKVLGISVKTLYNRLNDYGIK